MFVIANRFKIKPGFEEAFEARFRNRAHLVESMPGFIKWELHRPIGEGYYASVTYWESRAHHDAWRESDAFRQAHQHSGAVEREMFAEPNVLEMKEVIQSSYPAEAFLENLRKLHRTTYTG